MRAGGFSPGSGSIGALLYSNPRARAGAVGQHRGIAVFATWGSIGALLRIYYCDNNHYYCYYYYCNYYYYYNYYYYDYKKSCCYYYCYYYKYYNYFYFYYYY